MIEMEHLPRLFVIRHGNTDWSESRKHTGRADLPLNESGEQQARSLGSRLRSERFTHVFCSPLRRVHRTCEIAGFADRAEVCPNLTEWNYGDYEGVLTADVHRVRPDWYLYGDGAPNGESPQQVATRADRFIAHVRPLGGDIAAFSSEQIIRMIAARWLGLPPIAAKYFYTDTTSVGVMGYEHNRNQPVVQLWNDIGPGSLNNAPFHSATESKCISRC